MRYLRISIYGAALAVFAAQLVTIQAAKAQSVTRIETITTEAPVRTTTIRTTRLSNTELVQPAIVLPTTDRVWLTQSAIVLPTVPRSNYVQRLSDLLAQINMGERRGWLSADQAINLRNWQANLMNEEAMMRTRDGGIVSRADADVLEQHVNGLALTTSRELNAAKAIILP